MTPERWKRIEALYQSAIALEPDGRAAYLSHECADDAELLREVEALLRADTRGDRTISEAIQRAAGELMEARTEALVGRQLGAWRLVRRIAQGGMGSVYLAERCDGQFEQRAAVKLLNPALLSADALARFNGERQILARLSHPSIARLIDGGTTHEGVPYLVMEYIDGLTIDAFCREQRLSTHARLELVRKVCAAVEYAHRNLVVHRDIKPSNVLVDALGEPKLLDFGVAKLIDREPPSTPPAATVAELRALTPRYASPEQLRGQSITTATDVYSLGVLLYELLSGRSPYGEHEASPRDLHDAIVHVDPRRPSAAVTRSGDQHIAEIAPERLRRELAGDLDNIVLMALRKEPDRRYRTAEQLADDIGRHLAHQPVLARRATIGYRTTKFARRHRAMVLAAVAGTAALAALGVFHAQRLTAERDRALQAERLASDEAERSREVTEFLVDTFKAVDPFTLAPNPNVTARELLDRAVANLETRGGASRSVLQRVGLTMSRAYAGLELIGPARNLAERALAEIEGAHAGDSRELAEAHDVLARVEAVDRKWPQARLHAERALAIYERIAGPESLEVGRVIIRLAGIYAYLDQLEAQRRTAERALAILQKTRGPEAVETLDATLALAAAYINNGELEQALHYNQTARDGYRRLLGPTHMKLDVATYQRAQLMYQLGRFREGMELAREEQQILNAAVGPKHRLQSRPYRMMYINSQKLGDVRTALEAIRNAIAIQLAAPYPDLGELDLSCGNLAHLLLSEGFIDAAKPWIDRSSELIRRLQGPDGSDLAYNYMYYGIIAYKRGDYEAARRELDRALVVDRNFYPAEHVEVLKKRLHREYVEHLAGRSDRSAAGLGELIAILERSAGPDHAVTIQAVGYLAEANAALGNTALAESQYQRAVAALEKQGRTLSAEYVGLLRTYASFVQRVQGVQAARPVIAKLTEAEGNRTLLREADVTGLRTLAASVAELIKS